VAKWQVGKCLDVLMIEAFEWVFRVDDVRNGGSMTVIDQIRDEISDKAGTLIWSANLVAALGEPKDWEYTGLCVEGDPAKTHCACGHPIAECYIIEHKVVDARIYLHWIL